MIRTIALAVAMAAAAALPAVAADTSADTSSNSGPTAREFTAQLTAQAHQGQLRRIAAGRGYIVTSEFSQSGSGHWVASAMRDGKPTTVAVKMPPRDLPEFIN
jgi:hypothetical protein